MQSRRPQRSPVRAVRNPPNPWQANAVDWVGEPPTAALEVYEDHSRSILARNTSPDIPFTWSLNPYRGCYHACAYCYARPSHQHLDFGAGTDFDRRLVAKPRAAELLRAAFEKRSWRGELVVFSGNTDCYQPLEASYRLTRACLVVCAEYHNPVSIITKSALVERDVDVLRELQQHAFCRVTISLPFSDAATARAVEPGAPSPARRLKAIRVLADAGLEVGVNVAPIIPGLNDEELVAVLEGAKKAGASYAGYTLVRLPGPVAEVFSTRMREAFPLRVERILSQIAECRGGQLTDGRFGARMRGRGQRWEAIQGLFELTIRRLGLAKHGEPPEVSSFQRPEREVGARQLALL